MPNPFEGLDDEPIPVEVELDSLGRKKGVFDRRIKHDKNQFRGEHKNRFKTTIYHQVKERDPMKILPIELIARVKYLYARKMSWQKIHEDITDTFFQYKDISEDRLKGIYTSNSADFKRARAEFEAEFNEKFQEEREALFTTTLSAEVKMAELLKNQVDKLSEAIDSLDPGDPDRYKQYTSLVKSLEGVQTKLAELANTSRFRRLEENKLVLQQRKEILGVEEKKEKEVIGVTIHGSNEDN
jgi:hypothetical protein